MAAGESSTGQTKQVRTGSSRACDGRLKSDGIAHGDLQSLSWIYVGAGWQAEQSQNDDEAQDAISTVGLILTDGRATAQKSLEVERGDDEIGSTTEGGKDGTI